MTCGDEGNPFSEIIVEGIIGGSDRPAWRSQSIIANEILLILLRFENDSDARRKRSQD